MSISIRAHGGRTFAKASAAFVVAGALSSMTWTVRTAGLLVFLWFFLVFRQLSTPLAAQDPADRDRQAFQARSIGITLLDNYPEAADDASRVAMRKAIADYDRTWAAVAQLYNDRPLLSPERVHEGLA